MEAGLIALLLLFGYVAVDETSETKESTEKIIVNEKQIDFDYQVIGNVEQRFFKNNYQLQIKQFHYDSQVKYIDAITNLSINSADWLNYTTSFIDEIDNGEKYRNEFKVKAQLLPKTNNEFDFGYVFNHLEYSLDSSKKDYEMTLEDRMSLYTNKVFTIKYKNNQYELKLKDLGYSETFKNVENLNCKKEVVCEILKENTIKYKEVKDLKSVKKIKFSKKKKEEVKKQKIRIIKGGEMTFDNYKIHTVRKKDTIDSLARKYDVPQKLIMDLNKLSDFNLRIGDKIVIVNKTTKLYRVAYGDTLFKISMKYNQKISSLMKSNNLKNENIKENQILIIKH